MELLQLFKSELANASTSNQIEELRVKYLGKSGLVTESMKKIATLPAEEKKAYGASVNAVKIEIENIIQAQKAAFEAKELAEKLAAENVDITLAARKGSFGRVHPISRATSEIKDIFHSFGFECLDGPEIEDDWHNFTALNVGENHPARQMHDTFYIKDTPHLLRTHTSNSQIRHISKNKPPMRFITIGKVFRSDMDATHSPMFHQLEGVYIDKAVNIGQLKYTLEQFLQKFFNVSSAPIRMRASHFPFTEPSMEVDVMCDRSGSTLKIGEGNDWIEILGSGMIHPQVLKNCGLDPNEYQGFAFGAGIERLAMLKYGITDLRKFYEGDIRWLQHYGFLNT